MGKRNDLLRTGRPTGKAASLPLSTTAAMVSCAEATLQTLSAVHDYVVVSSETASQGVAISPMSADDLQWFREASSAISYATGLSASGVSVGLLLDTSRTSGIKELLESAVSKQIPMTVVLSEPLTTIADASQPGSHGVMRSVLDSGAPVLSASSAQEAVDFVAVASTLSRLLLLPVVVHVDGRDTLWALERVSRVTSAPSYSLPDGALRTYRRMLLGDDESGNVAWIDTAKPMEIGSQVPEKLGMKQRVGRHAFLHSGLEALVDDLFVAFEREHGRSYAWNDSPKASQKDLVLIATGSLAPRLEAAVDALGSKGAMISVIGLSQLRPFPSVRLARQIRDASRVAVLGSTGGLDPDSTELLVRVQGALQALASQQPTSEGRKKSKRVPLPSPIVFPVTCPTSWNPAPGDVLALATRLMSEQQSLPLLVGTPASGDKVRLPEVERIRQKLQAEGINLTAYEIANATTDIQVGQPQVLVATRSARDTWRLMTMLSGVLSATGVSGVRASFHPTSDATTHPVVGQIRWNDSAHDPQVVLARGSELFGTLALREALRKSSDVFLVDTEDSVPKDVSIPRFPHWMAARNLSVREIDVSEYEIPSIPAELIPDWALVGSFLFAHPLFKDRDLAALAGSKLLGNYAPPDLSAFVQDIGGRISDVSASEYESSSGQAPEPEVPREVAKSTSFTVPVADLSRFWKTTGVLYREGRLDDLSADPFLTSGALPARSGSLTQQLFGVKPIPQVVTDRCTGCGACWTMCPESAFSSSLFSLEALFDAAVGQATKAGTTFLHVTRLRPTIIKTMHRLAGRDDLHQFTHASELVKEASRQVLEKAGFDAEKLSAVNEEIAAVSIQLSSLRPIRTRRYFDQPESEEKGSGRFLGLTIDPFACTTCGLCISSCPDDALERTDTAAQSMEVQSEWHQLLDLAIAPPPVPAELFTDPSREQAPVVMIGRSTDRVFRAGGADVGNVNRTALRLFLEAAHAHSEQRLEGLTGRLSALLTRIDEQMQTKVQSTVEINDFDAFTRSLKEFSGTLDEAALSEITSKSQKPDAGKPIEGLSHLAELRARCADWLVRLRPEDGQAAQSHTVLVKSMSERSFGLAGYPINPFAMPCITSRVEDAGDLVQGLSKGLRKQYVDLLRLVRTAEQVLEGVYDPQAHDGQEMHAEEIVEDLAPLVLLVTDKLGSDILRMLTRERGVKVLLMSDGTSLRTPDRGGVDPLIGALSLDHVYVQQTPILDPVSLLTSFLRAMVFDGPAVLHVYAPDPVRDGLTVDRALRLSQTAHEARVFPTIRRIPGSVIDLSGNPKDPIAGPSAGDWLLGQQRYAGHFEFVPRRDWSSDQIRLSDWLHLPESERKDGTTYVEKKRPDGLISRYIADDYVKSFSVAVQGSWRHLQKLAGQAVPVASATGPKATEDSAGTIPLPVSPPDATDSGGGLTDALSTLTDRLFDMSGFRGANLSLNDLQPLDPQEINSNGNHAEGSE